MSEVFLSYRQTDDAQMQRVREFGECLRAAGITVILDQFFEDDNPAGPKEGWPQWSSNRASRTDYVLIVGTKPWFHCFEGTQPFGEGLGSACEARVIRQRIYDAGGVIDDIRIVLFDDPEGVSIPIELRGYHRFHVDRDFKKIVRWLGGKIPIDDTPRSSIPHNLPSLQPFFGREEELKTIADALLPESRTWGALINGPGGMGKTSLAVRAAYDASAKAFEKIVFISLKSRMLDDDGERDLSGFLISGLAELLNELARELGHADIAKATEAERPRMLLDALRGTRTLVVLDNLESLLKRERDIIFTFVEKLPVGCKAILTARGRIGSGGKEIILPELSQEAALGTLAKLAENNPALQRTSEAERLILYCETGGNPLLLRWTAGQIGRGSCITLTDAIAYLRSCPEGNDPLEFIFGDLVENFSEAETHILCALTYFNLPTKVEHISDVAECSSADTDRALRSLANRSLVVPSEELKTFALVPLVADFLRKKKPEVIAETSDRLANHVYALVVENGYDQHDHFPVLDDAWPTIAAALPRFLAAENDRFQTVCESLRDFLNFTGRWDEWLALAIDAEERAVAARDFNHAGWRVFDAGWIYSERAQSAEVLACAERAEAHWSKAQAGVREKASAMQLRGWGFRLTENYEEAILAHRNGVELLRTLRKESRDLVSGLNSIARIEFLLGDYDAAERNFREALQIARVIDYREGVVAYTGNLASVALERGDWSGAEALAREALSLSEKLGRQELIAMDHYRVAWALVRQNKKTEALLHARRAVDICTRLGSGELAGARRILAECES
ncbi:MAG TPA: tetratricopeptide repeat protein [Pyrinomonadaceae bacterium]|nr:tetratricopeptide repeat protein [Pyrinomonadaceae bacterium]